MGTLEPHSVNRQGWPGYPTRLEVIADLELLKRHMPAAWLSNRELTAAAGVFLAANLAGCGEDQASQAGMGAAARAAALVAPVFVHGEGTFPDWRCVFDGAPTGAVYTKEEVALTVISEELRRAGLSMVARDVPLDRVVIHGHDFRMAYNWVGGYVDLETYEVNGPLLVDLVDPQRRVYVEYLAQREYYPLGGQDTRPDLSEIKLAEQLSAQVRRQADGIVFGAFYDPVVYDRYPNGYPTPYEETCAKAQELLRLQVQDFVDWLKAQGVL